MSEFLIVDELTKQYNDCGDEIEANNLNKKKQKPPPKKKPKNDAVRHLKGVILSATKPSYTLQRGRGTSNTEFESLRWLNRNRLFCVLRKLMRRRNWDEATGILSVLLNGTCKDKSVSRNRIKYLATIELLKHNTGVNPKKFQHIFETWMKKIGTTRGGQTKDRFVVQLEFILFCLMHGNIEDARQAVICLMQEREFRTDPISNLIVGLMFSQEWYTTIQKEFPNIDFEGIYTPNQSEMLESRFELSMENSNGNVADEVEGANYPIQRDSDNSVRIDKETGSEEVVNKHQQVSIDADQQRKTSRNINEPQAFYVSASAETEELREPSMSGHVSIFYAHDMEPWLLPLQFLNSTKNLDDFLYVQKKIHNDSYKEAVKYLRLALSSRPPIYEALLPLVQMLLIGDQVKDAVGEIEKVVASSNAALPLRLKACLLEHFDFNYHVNLSNCFEDALKKDPACSHSLTRLLNLHRNGEYSADKLLEMMALHLDATFAEYNTWKEFASCFLKLSRCEEDRMSICLDGSNGELLRGNSNIFNRNHGVFALCVLGKEWRFRCRWWLSRHFSMNMLLSEIAAGNLELITYKAASASHIYGRDLEYVVKAFNCLEEVRNKDMLSFLKMHMENSVGFYFNFKKNH